MRVLVYARTHTQTTWVLDVSPGVGRIPAEPEDTHPAWRPKKKVIYICQTPGIEQSSVRSTVNVSANCAIRLVVPNGLLPSKMPIYINFKSQLLLRKEKFR